VRRRPDPPPGGATGAQATVILPGRGSSPLPGKLLHGRTADKIAAAVSRVPNVAVTVIPRRGPRPSRRGPADRANSLITPADGFTSGFRRRIRLTRADATALAAGPSRIPRISLAELVSAG
jgi:hypothetical protein